MKITSEIRNPDGSLVFQLQDVEVPAQFSQVAADILAQKYFRKAGVPARLRRVPEEGVPEWLWRSEPDEEALAELPEEERFGHETSARQVYDRLVGAWTYWGWKGGYFWSAPGPTGAGRAATSTARRTPAPSMTSCAT